MRWSTKVKRYNLDKLASELFAQGKSFSAIADACNKELALRSDNDRYTEITPHNIKSFIESLARDNNLMKQNLDLQKKSIDLDIDVLKELRDMCNITKQQLQQAYEEGNTLDYTKLHTQYLEALKVIATIEGKLKNYVSIDFLNTHIVKIVEIIVKDPYIDSNDKRRIITNIKSETASIFENMRSSLTLPDENESKPKQEN